MKRILFLMLMTMVAGFSYGQTTYYWVGGAGPSSFTANSNWNTQLDGLGTTRAAAATSDILVFSGANIGGTTPATGTVTVTMTSNTINQLKLVSNSSVVITRGNLLTGTGTLTIAGNSAGDDLSIEAGSTLAMNSATADGSVQMVFGTGAIGRVGGTLIEQNTGSQRITNGTANTTASLIFSSGGKFISNITASAASYPFGSNAQSSEKWVVFESGASLYYEGGWSPMGNNSAFSAIDFKPGSNWYHHATNVLPSVFGSFFNTKSFGNIIVENGATLNPDGPIYRIGNLTVAAGSTMTTHTSGQTVVLGNMIIDGTFAPPAGSTNVLVLGGNTQQTVSGSGTISVFNLIVADNSDVVLQKSIAVATSTGVYGKLNFNANQITGAGTFTSRVANTATPLTGTLVAGSYQITAVAGTIASINGLTITGAGIPANTNVVGFSAANTTINLSQPVTASGTGVALNFSSDTAILATSHPNGLDSLTGAVVAVGTKSFQSGTSYIINGATTKPFGISSGSTNTYINAGFVEINAPVTVNRGVSVYGHLTINAKLSLRPLDTVHVISGAYIDGAFGNNSYIATNYDAATGVQSIVQYDGITASTIIPIGTANYYLPVTIAPSSSNDIAVAVFEGITSNGNITGPPLTAAQKQSVVNAVWNFNRVSGTGAANVQLGWNAALEGSTFTTLPNTDIGMIINNGSSWSLPIGTGNNTTNIVLANVSSFGSFSVGAVPPTSPFVFNAIPNKTYGAVDFNGGATSLNTTQPIVYTSSNPLVATIVGGNIHITGAGTTNITATQASDGFYPAASITQPLTVNKAALTITADNKTKFEGQANPTLTASYTGFVYTETSAVLLTPATLSTTATTASAPGTYPITVSGATAANYNITFVPGTLTVQAKQNQTITFATLAAKTYGAADFTVTATSTNNTIPITFASSNPAVATITGNTVHITGAGTTNIIASQAGNAGFFPAADVIRALVVNKAALAIKVRDTSRVEGQPNPPFTITYTGFVLGESASNLLTPVVATTTATIGSAPGYYPITLTGATSNNYTITYTNGRLTVLPLSGATELYLNAWLSNSTTLSVRVYSATPHLADITVYDIAGRPLARKNLFMPVGFIGTDLQVPTLPSGIYIVTVRGDGVDLKKTISIMK